MARKGNSRPARWERATSALRDAADRMRTAQDELDDLDNIEDGEEQKETEETARAEFEQAGADALAALNELNELKGEYEDWRDNLPESLQSSPVGEKLDAICDIDFDLSEDDLDGIEQAADEAENADLPLGFGKD